MVFIIWIVRITDYHRLAMKGAKRNPRPHVSEEQQALLELYDKLDEAEEQSAAGKHRPFRESMAELRNRINAKVSN